MGLHVLPKEYSLSLIQTQPGTANITIAILINKMEENSISSESASWYIYYSGYGKLSNQAQIL